MSARAQASLSCLCAGGGNLRTVPRGPTRRQTPPIPLPGPPERLQARVQAPEIKEIGACGGGAKETGECVLDVDASRGGGAVFTARAELAPESRPLSRQVHAVLSLNSTPLVLYSLASVSWPM